MANRQGFGTGYQCGICGRFSRTQQRVPQCGVCMTPLCTTCNHSGFCANHFELLTPDEQALALATSHKMKQGFHVYILGLVVGFVAILVGMPVGAIPIFQGGHADMFWWFAVPMNVFLLSSVSGIFYFQLTTRRGSKILQGIGQKYQSGQDTSIRSPPLTAIGAQGESFGPQTVPPATPVSPSLAQNTAALPDLPSTRICPYCGSNLPPTAQYCSNCRSTIP